MIRHSKTDRRPYILTTQERDAVCRAYWEFRGYGATPDDDGSWDSLPEDGKRRVEARIMAALRALGVRGYDAGKR